MSIRCKAFLAQEQKLNHFSHIHKVDRIDSVLNVVRLWGWIVALSLPIFGQTPATTVEKGSPIDRPRANSSHNSGGDSPYVVTVSHLRIPETAVRHLEAAHQRFAKKELDKAETEIDRAIRVYPGFAQAFCMRALVQLAEKDFTGSVESAAHAISLDAMDAYSWIALATAFNSLGEWPEAEAAAGRALALNSLAWQGRLELAKSFYGEGKFVLALDTLNQVGQDIPDIYLVRANSLMRVGREQEAVRQLSIFLLKAPGDSRAEQIREILSRVQVVPN